MPVTFESTRRGAVLDLYVMDDIGRVIQTLDRTAQTPLGRSKVDSFRQSVLQHCRQSVTGRGGEQRGLNGALIHLDRLPGVFEDGDSLRASARSGTTS
jgi:hypothetical protein